MKRYRLFTAISLVGALLLASCSQDETIGDGNTLPEGKYPLEIASVTMSVESSSKPWSADVPKTRVSENTDRNSSVWADDDQIRVGIAGYADNDSRIYDIKVEGKQITVSPSADGPVYWKNISPAKVFARYPSDGTVVLNNQTTENGLAYALFAETTDKVDYNTPNISLPFEHKLAKVRVVLKGTDKGKVTDVKIKTYTSCTLGTDGTVKEKDKGDFNFIPMVETSYNNGTKCWEANVVPGKEIQFFKVNGGGETKLSKSLTPQAAKVNTITLTAGKDVVEGGTTIDKEGEYLMKGSYNETITINCTDKVTLTLDEVESTAPTAIHVTGGTPTIIVKGKENEFKCSGTPILLDPGAGVTIEGEDKDNRTNNKLTVQAGGNSAGIGSGAGNNESSMPKEACGNITINGITLYATGSQSGYGSGAAIGTAGTWAGSCGDINITNSEVHAQGGPGAAAIGIGNEVYRNVTCGAITITNSQIHATVVYYDGNNVSAHAGYPACIGHGACSGNNGYTASVGMISIITDEEQDVFFSNERFKVTNGNTADFYKAGKGTAQYNTMDGKTSQVWQGIKFGKENEQTDLAGKNDNGYQ